MVTVAGCANEQQQKGHELYSHYCSHCHGESGKQNEGFNWSSMPDPKPKDLTNKSEMSTLKDEDIFNTISRDMKDTSEEGGDEIGERESILFEFEGRVRLAPLLCRLALSKRACDC